MSTIHLHFLGHFVYIILRTSIRENNQDFRDASSRSSLWGEYRLLDMLDGSTWEENTNNGEFNMGNQRTYTLNNDVYFAWNSGWL